MERHKTALQWVVDNLDAYLARLDDLDDESLALVFEADRLRDAAREQPAFDRLIDNSEAEQAMFDKIILFNRSLD